jgi:glycosyltransferase involved in cell wall biosynthesis
VRVAFDGRSLQGRPRGMGLYGASLLAAMRRLPRPPDITLLVDAALPAPDLAAGGAFPAMRTGGPGGLMAGEQWWLPRAARGFDLLHCPANGAPVACAVPVVVTVHDVIFLRRFSEIAARPGVRHVVGHLYRTHVYPRAIRAASRVITVSETSRREIAAGIGLNPAAIAVVPEAVPAPFASAVAEEEDALRRRYGLDGPFLVAMGAYEKRKNIPLLFAALASVRRSLDPPPLLVLAGAEDLTYSGYQEAARSAGVGDLVRFLPYVRTGELKGLFAAALAFCMPSRREGFGLPVLEAMSVGAPVLASRISAHEEVAAEAALLLPEDDPRAWADAMLDVARNPETRDRLRRAGLARAARFSWDWAAEATAAVYAEVIE